MSKHNNIESKIISLFKSDKQAAISVLYENYVDALYIVIYKVVQSEEEAKDLLQDAFVKIWKNIDNYDSSKGKLYTWVLNVARNNAIDYIRSKRSKKNKLTQGIDDAVFSNMKTNTATDHIGVNELVEKLDKKYQFILDLVYFQGYTHKEIEKEFGIPLGTVKTRLRSAILQLRKKTKH